MFLRVVIASILGLYSLSAYSFEGWDKVHWGSIGCGGWEWIKQNYEDHPNDFGAQYAYAGCLFIKGKHQNNPSEVDTALYMLYTLADDYKHITASNFLAEYLKTDGTMSNFGFEAGINNLDRSIYYYQQVLAEIALRNGFYANPQDFEYRTVELSKQMELQSHKMVPFIYLQKYFWGLTGIGNQKLLESSIYDGDRNLEMYPEYAPYTEHSLIQMRETAESCLSVPLKEYFKPRAYHLVREICKNYKEQAEKLYELELKRIEEMAQDYCKDILSPGCPVTGIFENIQLIINEYFEITEPLHQEAWKALWN